MARTTGKEMGENLKPSPLLVEVLLFFHRNPSVMDRVEGISTWLGRRPEHILPSLERLTRAGVLQSLGRPPRVLYRYSRDPAVRAQVARWVKEWTENTR
jgi:hypothetical protein